MLRLMVLTGPDAGLMQECDDEVVTVGRAPTNQLVLTDPRVSGRHGEIVRAGGGYRYQDVGSRNGSQVITSGKRSPVRAENPVPLGDGDAIALGPGTLVVARTTVSASAEVSSTPDGLRAVEERLERDPVGLLTLYQFERRIRAATALPDLATALVEAFGEAFLNATDVVLLLPPREGDPPAPVAAHDRFRGHPSPDEVWVSAAMLAEVRETRSARLYRDNFRDLPPAGEGQAWPIFSHMAAPLLVGDEELGAVQIDHRTGAVPFGDTDLELFAVLCHRAAVAVHGERIRERHRRTEQEHLARAIQRDVKDWTLLVAGLADEVAGGIRRLFATLDMGDASVRVRTAGERDYLNDAMETLRANVALAKEFAFPLSHFLLESPFALDLESVEVGGLLRQIARTVRPSAPHEIVVTETKVPPVKADRALLFRVLLNLVENALEAEREAESEATVTLSAEVVSDSLFPEGRCLAIRVIDAGEGIPPDLLHRLLEGETLTTRTEGTGMGIAIARGIIENHGGSLELESREGEGTTATVKLPLA